MNKEAIRLLDRLYKDLYLSEEVLHHSSGNKYDKFNNIKEYMEKLEDIHTRVFESKRHINYLKKLYYDKYVIKAEDIPESYYEHQNEIALERGYGHVTVDIEQAQEEVINNQKSRLDVWLDYFLSEDAKVYPFWAKYWAFQGMLKLGIYDKEKGEFNKRTRNTVEPFADLNREALAMSIDMMIKMLNKEEIDDKELEILVKTGSFQKIYSYILTKVLKDNKNITKRNIGKWIKYDRGSDHIPLVESLKGYNTGWCTAGESTAKNQLQGGNFYVYYTLDENDEYKVPRIAIRMEYNQIVEIRGIAQDQNIESEMEEVVEEKLKEFPDREQYYKKVSDMKKLTAIYKKHKNKEELTKEELRFLYEIDDEIVGFGYDSDPRINKIIASRLNPKGDILNVTGCAEEQIAETIEQLNKETIYFFDSTQGRYINIRTAEFVNLNELENVEGIVFPKTIQGYLKLGNLKNAKGLTLPKNIGCTLDLSGLRSAEGLVLPENIGKSLLLHNLRSAEGLVLPKKLGNSLFLNKLSNAKGLVLPENIEGNLNLQSLTNAEGLTLPKNIGGDLNLNELEIAEGMVFPKNIGNTLFLGSLTSAKGLVLPENIGNTLFLSGLTDSEGLILPKSIGGSLFLNGLISAEGLVLPENIGGAVHLRSLTSSEDLIIPDPLIYPIYMCDFDITPENVDKFRNNKTK